VTADCETRFIGAGAASSLEKISPTRQANSPQAQIADSSSRKAVNFSSARAARHLPSSRCASAIQIVRPLESIAETQPELQPVLLRLSAMISSIASCGGFCLFCVPDSNDKVILIFSWTVSFPRSVRHHYAISKKLVDQALLGYSRATVGALILRDAVWSGKF
jgi:hypothetical protein